MLPIMISPLGTVDDVEIVERKGFGHPDTICDALAETLSRNLCREYQHRFGRVLHHNVDKALLSGGQAAPAFGGGSVTAPIRIFLAGRAITTVGNEAIPVDEIAVEGSRAWLKANLHALDVERHVRIETLVHQGSQDLQGLFSRKGRQGVPLANDTSFGVGHAPLSALERLVRAIEQGLHGRDRRRDHPAWGEDIKVMAVRNGSRVDLTVACAMIGGFLAGIGDYLEQKTELAAWVHETAGRYGFPDCSVTVNAADDALSGSVYLTVTGTSAESGDDGQVGRGNRVNGLITPCRPMSLGGGRQEPCQPCREDLQRSRNAAGGGDGRGLNKDYRSELPYRQQERRAGIRTCAGQCPACNAGQSAVRKVETPYGGPRRRAFQPNFGTDRQPRGGGD